MEDLEGARRKSVNTSPLVMVRFTGDGCQSEELDMRFVPAGDIQEDISINSM